jgi:hypothetical protein
MRDFCCPVVHSRISKERIKGWSNLVGLFDESSETLEEMNEFTISPNFVKYVSGITLANYLIINTRTTQGRQNLSASSSYVQYNC